MLVGGPGTGKTSIVKKLDELGYACFHEISRQVTLEAQKEGIEQLFLEDPILFSKKLLEGREQQYLKAKSLENDFIFFDRGIPDVLAYLVFSNSNYPSVFKEKSKQYKYDIIFHFKPWEKIHETDNERYESFEETQKIDHYLVETYSSLNYNLITVPFDSIENRVDFILNTIKNS